MNAAVVLSSGLVVFEVVRLRIFALVSVSCDTTISRKGVSYKARIVIGGARRLHTAQSNAFDTGHEAIFTDEPICLVSSFVLDSLLDHDAKHIRYVLVESAALTGVIERGGVFCDGVLKRS